MASIYTAALMEHNAHPDYKYQMDEPTCTHDGVNPSCGDELTLALRLRGDRIEEAAFTGHGCAVSQAAADMMADLVTGETVGEARRLSGLYLDMIKGRPLTDEERAAYVDSYLTEGDFDDSGSIKIFPVAKSTELLFLNDTDWKPFAAATGAQDSELETVEGLVKTAEAYYNWTDAQTDTPNDGKALFGRDAMANYMLIGAKELGDTIFDVKDGKMTMGLSEDAARRLWDNYYVPYIKGWAAASGRFRSDDIKIGSILAYIGSNSSATYFPTQVMLSDTESHDIELKVPAHAAL